MYERITDRCRRVMQLANAEARRFHHEYIGTEHLLLGILQEGDNVAAMALKSLGVTREQLAAAVLKFVQEGPDKPLPHHLAQTPRAKRVFEFAIEEARALGNDYVGTEHLLLGLIREHDGVGSAVLFDALGLSADKIRAAVLGLLNSDARPADSRASERIEKGSSPAETPAAELDAMATVAETLRPLDRAAMARVLRWVCEYYQIQP